MSTEPVVLWTRQRVLGATLIVIALMTTIALFEVLGTVFLALTVAFILSPARRWLRNQGVGRIPATLIVTAGAVVAVIAVLAPFAFVLFVRFDQAIALIAGLPETVEVSIGTLAIEFELAEVRDPLEAWLRATAISASAALPVFLLKFALFGFVVFAIIHHERDISDNVMAVVPPAYRDVAHSLNLRARDTLAALYVLQGATAAATVVIALPVFYFFGYEAWLALSMFAGVLQFVPVVGPSVLILALMIAEVLAGDIIRAILMLIVGGVLVAAVPDVLVRPRLARRTTQLSGVLYFVGFVGGLLSLGAIGIIVGPLLVALLVEATNLVSAGFSEDPGGRSAEFRG